MVSERRNIAADRDFAIVPVTADAALAIVGSGKMLGRIGHRAITITASRRQRDAFGSPDCVVTQVF